MFQTYFIQQKYEIITIAEYKFLSHEKFHLEVLYPFYGPIADFAVEPIDLNEERSSFFANLYACGFSAAVHGLSEQSS